MRVALVLQLMQLFEAEPQSLRKQDPEPERAKRRVMKLARQPARVRPAPS